MSGIREVYMKFSAMMGVAMALLAVAGVSAQAQDTKAKQKNKVGEMRTVSSCGGVSSESSASNSTSSNLSSVQTDEHKPAAAQAAK